MPANVRNRPNASIKWVITKSERRIEHMFFSSMIYSIRSNIRSPYRKSHSGYTHSSAIKSAHQGYKDYRFMSSGSKNTWTWAASQSTKNVIRKIFGRGKNKAAKARSRIFNKRTVKNTPLVVDIWEPSPKTRKE